MIRVQDCNGREIKVGTKATYGDPAPGELTAQTVEVVAISDPDVLYNPETDTDDGGYAVDVTIKFPDGDTVPLQAKILSSSYSPGMCESDADEVFEESGDLEVLA